MSCLRLAYVRTSGHGGSGHAEAHLSHLFPYVPQQSGYNKRLRKLADTMAWLTAQLGGLSTIGTDDVWVVDSTPVECGRSRETAKRSDLAGWAEYGYCAGHSRHFWGLRRHLVCTLHGLPIGWVLTGAKAEEREAFWAVAESAPAIAAVLEAGHRQTMIADKNYFGKTFEADLDDAGIELLRSARKGEKPDRVLDPSSRCGRSSSPSTTPSRASWTSNNTTHAHRRYLCPRRVACPGDDRRDLAQRHRILLA